MLLGALVVPLALVLSSGREVPESPDRGFNPGEAWPSLVVDGRDLGAALASEPSAVLVVWSVDDVTSRVANLWACNSVALRDADTPIYSLCIDGDDETANLYAKIDGADASVTPIGLQGAKSVRWSSQTSRQLGKVFYTSYGMIEKVISAETLLDKIQ